jgi:hypothetical protein
MTLGVFVLQGVIDLVEGQFHTLVALSVDAEMFELKQVPNQPTSAKDVLPKFLAKGTTAAADQDRRWRALFDCAARTSSSSC